MVSRTFRRGMAVAISAAFLAGGLAYFGGSVSAVDPVAGEVKPSASLSDDGHIGKIVDVQGLVSLRPSAAERWTPIGRGVALRPGDRLRTDIRGPNAVKLRLTSGVELTLGPGTLVECVAPLHAHIQTGELQVNYLPLSTANRAPPGNVSPFVLLGPDKNNPSKEADKLSLAGGTKTFHRVVDRTHSLQTLTAAGTLPKWLAGFEGSSTQESLGSLIVNLPDGRNEPLTIGYHKVDVEIRDQIARTTIEESFVNHTSSRLEGTFHFPLPQDASISGFGMWIGNELVEADVVEKQRAREIYETILRERRDPGLLEWTSGNLFKARVFPIEANSEKRVKIVYTQVLPLRGDKFRYQYGLRSDLLRMKPLRQLSVNVTIQSSRALKQVACTTHSARTQRTAHSAQVDYSAQGTSPDRDFEVVCEVDGRQNDVVVVPHRRGDDGYLFVQLSPPGSAGNWQRELVPDGEPITLVLLCDTSGSIDSEKRKQQAELVATMLRSLGDKDRFLLGATDVGTVWALPDLLSPAADNIRRACLFLDERVSLGWTNLDRAFEAALAKAPAGAQIVYIGDGIPTAGDRDPAAFVRRLKKMLEARRATNGSASGDVAGPTLHAVTIGNIHEAVVMRGIATVGGGSIRAIAGEQTPQVVARELLNEIARPGLRDLAVEFRGVKVGAMYPERLPNIAVGTQQILVARYLPEGKDQSGEIVVTGRLNNEPVRYAARVEFRDAEAGNSFIPRLWARSHLDHLLEQGSSPALQSAIIALSEEFHIITPYTSLLVLETDADRERFGVKRRFEMRDGEQFFREGKAQADFELAAEQMRRAGDWRLDMRRSVLRQLAALGRDGDVFHRRGYYPADLYGVPPFRMSNTFTGSGSLVISEGSLTLGGAAGDDSSVSRTLLLAASGELAGSESDENLEREDRDESVVDGDEEYARPGEQDLLRAHGDADSFRISREATFAEAGEGRLSLGFGGGERQAQMLFEPRGWASEVNRRGGGGFAGGMVGGGYLDPADQARNLQRFFPPLPPKPALAARAPEKNPPRWLAAWSPEALQLSESLLRTSALAKLAGGILVEERHDDFDPIWDRRTSHSSATALYAPKAWLTKTVHSDGLFTVDYGNERERGTYFPSLLLGRSRAAVEGDLRPQPLVRDDGSIEPLHEAHPYQQARVEHPAQNQALLIVSEPHQHSSWRYLIDTAKHVLLGTQWFHDDKLHGTSERSEFVEVGGTWWATKVVATDDRSRKLSETRFAIQSLEPAHYEARLKAESIAKDDVCFLHGRLPTLAAARRRQAEGSAGFEDRMVLLSGYCGKQQWAEALALYDTIEKLDGRGANDTPKPGLRRMRIALLGMMRRNEEARRLLSEEAQRLVAEPKAAERATADFLLAEHAGVSETHEHLQFLALLKPVYERHPDDLHALPKWQTEEREAWARTDRGEETLAQHKSAAQREPWSEHLQVSYAQLLQREGEFDGALAWLDQAIVERTRRAGAEDESLRRAYVDLLYTLSRKPELVKFTAGWIAHRPNLEYAYLQHLTALQYAGEEKQADELALRWMREARSGGKLSDERRARLLGAISFAQEDGNRGYGRRMDERWFEPMAETARFFLRDPDERTIVREAIDFSGEIRDRLRGEFFTILQKEVATLAQHRIRFLLREVGNDRLVFPNRLAGRKEMNAAAIPNEVWKPIADGLRARWEKMPPEEIPLDGSLPTNTERRELAGALRSIYASRFAETELLPFLRRKLEVAPPARKQDERQDLFETLVSGAWTEEKEAEAFGLIGALGNEGSDIRVATEIGALQRFVDAMLRGRQEAAMKALADRGEVDKLTRKELAERKAALRKEALAGVAKRLGSVDQPEREAKLPTDWLRMERAWLDVQLERNTEGVLKFCRTALDQAAATPIPDAEDQEIAAEVRVEAEIKELLQQRMLATWMYLATRKSAKPELAEQLLRYLDAEIARRSADDLKHRAGGEEFADAWRREKYRLLTALDRPDDLERELRAWIRAGSTTAPWRQELALVRAERGDLAEAIALFEAAEKDRLLSPEDYRRLANWYLATKRPDDYRRAKLESFARLPENILSNILYRAEQRRNAETAKGLPISFDEDTLFAFGALLTKAASPEHYPSSLRETYETVRDPRLLRWIPDGALGRSPQQIYEYLQGLSSGLLTAVRNEAATDEIRARIEELRKRELTPVDRRALDLLELVVEWKAAEVLDQPGPHAAACLALLERTKPGPRSEEETRQRAGLLKGLGTAKHVALRDEQLRQLKQLRQEAKPGSRDRLNIAADLGRLLFESYELRDEALLLFQAELADYVQARGGRLPRADYEPFAAYVSFLIQAGRFVEAETLVQTHEKLAENRADRRWFVEKLALVYDAALRDKAEVSLGKGETLFKSLTALGLKQIETAQTDDERKLAVDRHVRTFWTARKAEVPGVAEASSTFAFEQLPAFLKLQSTDYDHIVKLPMATLDQPTSHKEMLRYIVERVEQWPPRLQGFGRGPLATFEYEIAEHRGELQTANLKDLEARLFVLVRAQFKRHLSTDESNGIYRLFHRPGEDWKSRVGDFTAAAEEAYREQKQSGRRVTAVAAYVWQELGLHKRAIEMLATAEREGLLVREESRTLVEYLRSESRHAETLPVLESLVRADPDVMQDQAALLTAYHDAEQPQKAAEQATAIERHFHRPGRWTEQNIAMFAEACLRASLYEKAITYFNEAISLRRRASGVGRAVNDATLSEWYQRLAFAHGALAQMPEAVEAALGAVVCWSPRHERRKESLQVLDDVVDRADQLDRYVKSKDDEAQASGQDSPLLRKAFGKTYQHRGAHDKALVQLLAAQALQPNDREVSEMLITSYDALDRPTEGTRQLLAQIDYDRHDLTLYEQLAERLKNDEAETERATTSIVEGGPTEAENHAALAAIRQKQRRWNEAAREWAEVAELRRLEPTGLLGLAEVQLTLRQWDEARRTLDRLQKTEWPDRFAEPLRKVDELRAKLPK
ncbi:MAG: VIT and VWA domain-containing protein [Planctomycetia bacterium]|nr:VIT and VWA domain-containing protein [Planctomycetia bacterium]